MGYCQRSRLYEEEEAIQKIGRSRRVRGLLQDDGGSSASRARWGLIDRAFYKSWDGTGVLGGQDTTPQRSIQIGDGEVNRWYFYKETARDFYSAFA